VLTAVKQYLGNSVQFHPEEGNDANITLFQFILDNMTDKGAGSGFHTRLVDQHDNAFDGT